MTMKLPQKAGFVATPDEWDALVRIAENLAAQVVQRDAALREIQAQLDAAQSSASFWGRSCAKIMAERDAARAEAVRLTAALGALIEQADVAWATLDHTENERLVSRLGCAADDARAAMRQPAPAQPLDDDGVCKCGHARGQHRGVCMIFPCKCMEFTAQGQGQE